MSWCQSAAWSRGGAGMCGRSLLDPLTSAVSSATSLTRSVGRSGPHQSPSSSARESSRAWESRTTASPPASVRIIWSPSRRASPRSSTCRAASVMTRSGTGATSASRAGSTVPWRLIRSSSQLAAGSRSYPARAVIFS